MDSSMSDWPSTSRVSPFGYHGIYACLRLPHAFRSLPRPSSALGALASALCSCSLDFLENDLSIIVDPETNCLIFFPVNCYLILQLVFKDFFSSFFLCAVVKVRAEFLPLRANPENDTDLRKTVNPSLQLLVALFPTSFDVIDLWMKPSLSIRFAP